ncbi:MAG: hypothetical protein ACYCV4_14810 [Dermatophilaceae bacterium]
MYVTPTEGMEQCWSARAVDRFNQWGAWSSERCFLAPLGRVYTHSATSRTKVVIWLPRQAAERRGTLVIRSTSSKRVVADGVLIRHR